MKVLVLGSSRKNLTDVIQQLIHEMDLSTIVQMNVVSSCKSTQTKWSKFDCNNVMIRNPSVFSDEDYVNQLETTNVIFDDVTKDGKELESLICGNKFDNCFVSCSSPKSFLTDDIIKSMDKIIISKCSIEKQVEYWTQFIDPIVYDLKSFKTYCKDMKKTDYFTVQNGSTTIPDNFKMVMVESISESSPVNVVKMTPQTPELANHLSGKSIDVSCVQSGKTLTDVKGGIWMGIVYTNVKYATSVQNELLQNKLIQKIETCKIGSFIVELESETKNNTLILYAGVYEDDKNAGSDFYKSINMTNSQIVFAGFGKILKEMKAESPKIIQNSFIII